VLHRTASSRTRIGAPRTIVRTGLLAASLVVTALVAAGVASTATPKTVTVYSVVKSDQFISNADDRQRGSASNPFSVDSSSASNTAAATGSGPFPGDNEIVFNQLYTGPDLQKTAGTASVACDFVFGRNAICKLTVKLKGGAAVLLGPVLWGRKSFSLAISGGTGAYRSASGELQVTPATGTGAQVAQQFKFILD
jgi:hypothetical protein